MSMRLFRVAALALGCVLGFNSLSIATPLPFHPSQFNVFSLGDIGTTNSPYASDFQGIAGSVGGFYVKNFSFHDLNVGPGTGVSLYAGGDVSLKWGSTNYGGIEAGGNVTIDGFTVGSKISPANVRSGGNVTIKNVGLGQNNVGTVRAAGTVTEPTWWQWSPSLQVIEDEDYAPTLDLGGYVNYFNTVSAGFGNMSTTATPGIQWGNQFSVNLNSGVNVIELTALQLKNATDFLVNGPADATLVINVYDETVDFDSVTWNLQGGVEWSDLLINMPNALEVKLKGGNHVSLLAPKADTRFIEGLLIGNLVVGKLRGGGQVNAGQFNGFDEGLPPPPNPSGDPAVPEPLSAATLGLALTALALRRRR